MEILAKIIIDGFIERFGVEPIAILALVGIAVSGISITIFIGWHWYNANASKKKG